jgi:hypothetical protein
MSDDQKSIHESLLDWVVMRWAEIRAALAVPMETNEPDLEASSRINPDFKKWVSGDPMVTDNPASRYGDQAPGYLTRNGYGSLEIGARRE